MAGAEQTIYDLSLDRLIARLCTGEGRADALLRALKMPLASSEDIIYRQQILQDLDADRELLHRFIKCQLFGLCIDWMLGGMKPDTGEKMGRILELYRGVAELILENCRASNA